MGIFHRNISLTDQLGCQDQPFQELVLIGLATLVGLVPLLLQSPSSAVMVWFDMPIVAVIRCCIRRSCGKTMAMNYGLSALNYIRYGLSLLRNAMSFDLF